MEFVYVVERRRLFDRATPHGLVSAAERREDVSRWLDRIRAHGFFLERRKAEEDASFQQIIPYVVVRRSDECLLLQRKNNQGEARLHGKRSIGVGGHINPVDHEQGDILLQGLRRELEEELHVDGTLRCHVAGFLNDDTTEVGSVHFGLVAVADARDAQVSIRETEMMDGRFVALEELKRLHREDRDRFETWSSLLVDRLEDVLAADLPLDQVLSASG